jgi:hypothetical protein
MVQLIGRGEGEDDEEAVPTDVGKIIAKEEVHAKEIAQMRNMIEEPCPSPGRKHRPMKAPASHGLSMGLLCLLMWVCPVGAEEILVVGSEHAPVDALDRAETANLFLGLERSETDLTPYDQRDEILRRDFYREVACRSLASVRAHWAKRVFTGRGRPPAMLDAEAVEVTLEGDPTAVTYVPDDKPPQSAKVLLNLPRDEHR